MVLLLRKFKIRSMGKPKRGTLFHCVLDTGIPRPTPISPISHIRPRQAACIHGRRFKAASPFRLPGSGRSMDGLGTLGVRHSQHGKNGGRLIFSLGEGGTRANIASPLRFTLTQRRKNTTERIAMKGARRSIACDGRVGLCVYGLFIC